MIGNPGETRETVRKSIRFSLSLGLDYLMCCKVIPKPGTALYEDLVRRTGQDYWADLILGREEPRVLPRPWTSLTAEEVNRLARRMYLRFHLRPAYLWRAVRKVQSWGEFRRKLLALLDMTFTQEKGSVHHPDFDIYREPPADGPRA